MDSIPFKERAQTQERNGIRVTTAVLGRDESKQAFGVDLAKKQIQPVWLEIENASDRPYGLLLTATDPNYFSAHEAAYGSHFTLRPFTNEKIDEHFYTHELEPSILPHATKSGFLFTNLKLGTKEVRVRLFGPGRTETFAFYVQVPGFRAGWDETETLTWGSGWRTFKAFFGGTYKYSPMSALYLYGRSQDAGYQKARETIHQRNHLRLWGSPLKFRGQHVWVGTITRDIGVYFTPRSWNLTTHAIDPYVDEARTYIGEDFANAQAVQRLGYVSGVGAATREEPHRNLMMARWWTDGLRVVIEVPEEPTPLEEIGFFYWDWDTRTPEESEEINRQLRELQRRP
jgi:hypothetical protein